MPGLSRMSARRFRMHAPAAAATAIVLALITAAPTAPAARANAEERLRAPATSPNWRPTWPTWKRRSRSRSTIRPSWRR